MTKSRKIALLLDEMFSPVIAEQLRGLGQDVIAVAADPLLRSMTDDELYGWADTGDRRIVTENVKDFRPLLQSTERTGGRLLFTSSRSFPRSQKSFGMLVQALDAWLESTDVATPPPEDWLK